MRCLSEIILVLFQWILVIFGLFVVLVAINMYLVESRYLAELPKTDATGDTYNVPVFQRLMVGVTTGLVAMGLGAVLFYLRRLFISRIA